MTTPDKPLPTLPLLEQAATELMQERVLSKGGKQPSPEAVRMAAKFLALKAQREAKGK